MNEITYQLRFHIDQEGDIGIDLYTSNSLLEMNQFIADNFSNSKEIHKEYEEIIGEFSLNYQRRIERENARNHNKRLGSVSLFCTRSIGDKTKIYKLPILFKKRLLSKQKCFKKIKEELLIPEKLDELLSRKKYLLSKNERSLFDKYRDTNIKKYRDEATTFFMRRLDKLDPEKLQFYLQSLMNLFSLESENIIAPEKHTSDEFTFVNPQNNPEGFAPDDFFNELIRRRDYATLHELYGIEYISRYSNLLDENTNCKNDGKSLH